jgi:hypothetical protein
MASSAALTASILMDLLGHSEHQQQHTQQSHSQSHSHAQSQSQRRAADTSRLDGIIADTCRRVGWLSPSAAARRECVRSEPDIIQRMLDDRPAISSSAAHADAASASNRNRHVESSAELPRPSQSTRQHHHQEHQQQQHHVHVDALNQMPSGRADAAFIAQLRAELERDSARNAGRQTYASAQNRSDSVSVHAEDCADEDSDFDDKEVDRDDEDGQEIDQCEYEEEEEEEHDGDEEEWAPSTEETISHREDPPHAQYSSSTSNRLSLSPSPLRGTSHAATATSTNSHRHHDIIPTPNSNTNAGSDNISSNFHTASAADLVAAVNRTVADAAFQRAECAAFLRYRCRHPSRTNRSYY